MTYRNGDPTDPYHRSEDEGYLSPSVRAQRYRSEDIGTEGQPPRWAVVDNRDDGIPDVYVFADHDEAMKFLAWLRRMEPFGSDFVGTFIVEISPMPTRYHS